MESPAEYYDNVVEKIEGWLWRSAGLATMTLLDLQEKLGHKGPVAEIGILKGKYFSTLIRAAQRTGDKAFGIDIFLWANEETVRDSLGAALPPNHPYTLINSFSSAFTAETLVHTLGGSPRFMSIDGSHEADDVMWDLRVAENAISGAGIIAVDDFINAHTLGVGEGVHRFFATPRGVVPFLYLANKLFLCRPHMAQTYKDAIEKFAEANTSEAWCQNFIEVRDRDRAGAEQTLWGKKTLVFQGV